jgi:hypothetical protein
MECLRYHVFFTTETQSDQLITKTLYLPDEKKIIEWNEVVTVVWFIIHTICSDTTY